MSSHGQYILKRSTEIFVVGTFDTSPEPFAQIFIVLGRIGDKRPVPTGFALLPNKKFTTYDKLFQLLKSEANLSVEVIKRMSVDFE